MSAVLNGGRPATVLVPVGALGAGVNEEMVARGIAMGVDAIACDAGSTDSGAYYLSHAVAKYSRFSVKHDLRILVRAAREAGVPLLVGSCGTSGADAGVDWTADIVREIAGELGYSPRIALLYSEVDHGWLKRKLADGQTSPLAPAPNLTAETIDNCDHIVALMGPEPYIAALDQGADIVLGGRTSDTAVLASVPLRMGAPRGPAWHAAKITECGSLCTVNPRGGGVIMRIDDEGFEIEPIDADNAATPYTVSAHMLYENSDPFRLTEPGGITDASRADYVAKSERVTRVTGSAWEERPYTMKLEGAGAGDFQTIMLIGIADPKVLKNLEEFRDRMHTALTERTIAQVGIERDAFDISLRIYGWDAVTGSSVPGAKPGEVGMLFVATAATQEIATQIAKTCNPLFFHFPLQWKSELPTYAFPFSPAEIERGQVFEFRLNHVVNVADGHELVRVGWLDVAGLGQEEIVHA